MERIGLAQETNRAKVYERLRELNFKETAYIEMAKIFHQATQKLLIVQPDEGSIEPISKVKIQKTNQAQNPNVKVLSLFHFVFVLSHAKAKSLETKSTLVFGMGNS